MSQRKLQQDIDKLIKKVKEGLEDYEEIYGKFQTADAENTSYREKLESDLKREIKKLQKHRDQIKTWLSKEDVKDKQDVLLKYRRLIESGMERFKSIEKLMKTKQFSTEALTNPDIITDPKELFKRDQVVFIHECLDELQKQLEFYETQDNQQQQIERHEFHISNLENILKLLQNNEMEPETINEFQDDIKYYVEHNDDPDFIEYDTIYEDMNCEVKHTAAEEEHSSSTVSSNTVQKKQQQQQQEKSPSRKNVTPPAAAPVENRNSKQTTTAPEDVNAHLPKDKTDMINEMIKQDIDHYEAFQNPLFNDELKYWVESKRNLLQPPKEMTPRMVSQLESSLLNCPDSLDADTPHLYKHPLSLPHPTSVFFPHEPIRFVYPHDPSQQNANEKEDIYSMTSLARIFTKFDLDTLFFIFYHYQGTYEQLLSARELYQHRKWKFNKRDRLWYYREMTKSPPGVAQAEEETWRYFDYEKSWLARRCNNEFIYKEDDFEKL